ncbi:MAG: type 1 glutamine amidotransferase [Actinomycetota bacterium]|nr:type 1 glutamine amidotransferase [Actinomycetota bacterium]
MVAGMRALAIVHQADAGPGVFADESRARGVKLDHWLLPGGGDPPGDPADYEAVMTFGGAMHPDQERAHPWLREEKELLAGLIERGVPLLGVCLGSQLVAEAAGSHSAPADEPEIGWFDVELTPAGAADPLLGPLAPRFTAFQWHSYRSSLPLGGEALAQSPASLQAYRIGERCWGIQFHAEVSAHDAFGWTERYEADPAALAIGLAPDVLAEEIRARIEPWNALGRALCGRFLELSATRPGSR